MMKKLAQIPWFSTWIPFILIAILFLKILLKHMCISFGQWALHSYYAGVWKVHHSTKTQVNIHTLIAIHTHAYIYRPSYEYTHLHTNIYKHRSPERPLSSYMIIFLHRKVFQYNFFFPTSCFPTTAVFLSFSSDNKKHIA